MAPPPCEFDAPRTLMPKGGTSFTAWRDAEILVAMMALLVLIAARLYPPWRPDPIYIFQILSTPFR